ncbi:Atrial natriuretic peptide receptor 3, partial [Lamellibrachia satsuma]
RNQAMIAAVLPQDTSRLFSIEKVRPAAAVAIEGVHADGLLSSCHLDIHYKDSKCSEAAGMNEAINFFVEGRTSVFFGPVCDYAAAPVARQIGFWNVPMVSVGAMALDFFTRRQSVYPLLTRAGPANLQTLAQSFIRLMDDYVWTKVKVLYERDGRGEIISAFCHLTSEALVYGI